MPRAVGTVEKYDKATDVMDVFSISVMAHHC